MFATMFDTQQAWITPYAYTKKLPRNNRLLTAKAQVAVAAIAKFSNVVYKVESLGSIVTLSGASVRIIYFHCFNKHFYTTEFQLG